ncbi:MAG: GNAT family N-acetyltransferase [Spirochaetales bacterium]|nr:GNAT family N-acetyltransferase [Spirochaetales bacterium]
MKISDYSEAKVLWNGTEGMGLRTMDDSREGIETFLKRNPETCFISRTKGKLTGIILCGHDGRRGYIYHTAVQKDHRQQGIGKKLVEAALKALEKEGIKKAALVVFKDNDQGNRFWESMGFTLRDDLNYRNRVIDERNV